MKRALISIGIGRASGGLSPLKGAVQDARDFYAWGLEQCFDCTLLVDDVEKIRVADAYEAFQEYLNAGTYSQIVVYFSGHGILVAPDCELWLMSAAPANPNEAINVRLSIDNARYCGVEHVVFVSDACRTLPSSMREAIGGSGVLLPFNGHIRAAELDVYYATLPGNPALEISLGGAPERRRGLFTGCMLDALGGGVDEVLEDLNISGVANRVVHGRQLKVWLTTAVPRAAEQAAIVLQQRPEIRIESSDDRFLARFSSDHQPKGPVSTLAQHPVVPASPACDARAASRRLIPSRAAPPSYTMKSAPSRAAGARSALPRRSSFEEKLSHELIVARSLDADVAVFGGSVRGFSALGMLDATNHPDALLMNFCHVEPSENPEPKTGRALALTFEDGNCTLLNALPGYVTTVHLDGSHIGSINYIAKHQPCAGGESSITDLDLDKCRVEAALLARVGQLSIESNPARAYAGNPLQLQALDPMLGALVGYAYARAGRHKEWVTIMSEVRQANLPVLFDCELLATTPVANKYPITAPGMPTLTEGWILLGSREATLSARLRAVRQYLLPSLWATFSGMAAELLESHLAET